MSTTKKYSLFSIWIHRVCNQKYYFDQLWRLALSTDCGDVQERKRGGWISPLKVDVFLFSSFHVLLPALNVLQKYTMVECAEWRSGFGESETRARFCWAERWKSTFIEFNLILAHFLFSFLFLFQGVSSICHCQITKSLRHYYFLIFLYFSISYG